jgi:multidrug efflux pump subunit AcrB
MSKPTALGQFATRHRLAIGFISVAFCCAGVYSALRMSSSVFPQTNFPRVVILVDNGVMPADEMMATITRPIEEAMKDIPGSVTIRSTTGRGAAEISVFFNWHVDMIQSELYVDSRLAQIRSSLPATASTTVWRLTFSAFPIIGVSLTSPQRSITELWEIARYDLKPRFLRIPGVARVDLVGGRTPEYHVIVDPRRLQAANLSLQQIADELARNNLIAPTGRHEENHTLYLAVVDGRLHSIADIENLTVAVAGTHPIRIRDFARVERGPEPVFNVVTAEGVNAVLLNIRSQPDGSTLDIANGLKQVMREVKKDLPPDLKVGRSNRAGRTIYLLRGVPRPLHHPPGRSQTPKPPRSGEVNSPPLDVHPRPSGNPHPFSVVSGMLLGRPRGHALSGVPLRDCLPHDAGQRPELEARPATTIEPCSPTTGRRTVLSCR